MNSQRLRYIDLLLHNPWVVSIAPDQFDSAVSTTVRIANPAAFVAQKLLIHDKRGFDDQAKDILYIHDTLQVFGSRLHELAEGWRSHVRPQLNVRHAKAIERSAGQYFSEISDAIRDAARMATDRRISPESVRQSCAYGLSQILG